ncbi:MAG TPA: hypothetical protein VG498_11845, partial [Terriglobales bacterium]|nr:hypothetical protein [Terriglobales bacterium]
FSEQDARSGDEFRVRVGLFQMLDFEARAAILDAREHHLRTRLEKLNVVETNFRLDHYAQEVTSQFQKETQLELDWIERLRRGEKSGKHKQ